MTLKWLYFTINYQILQSIESVLKNSMPVDYRKFYDDLKEIVFTNVNEWDIESVNKKQKTV